MPSLKVRDAWFNESIEIRFYCDKALLFWLSAVDPQLVLLD